VECDLFNIEEILDESTLDIEILKDWHVDEVTGSTRQKLIEINVLCRSKARQRALVLQEQMNMKR